MIPEHVRLLAARAIEPPRARRSGRQPLSSPSLDREALADWLEENGLPHEAAWLRPRPPGEDDRGWSYERARVLDALAYEGTKWPLDP